MVDFVLRHPISVAETEPQRDATAKASSVTENPWYRLRKFTDARIGLGRAGVSLPTRHLLDFQLAHAQAKDAVHRPLNIQRLTELLYSLPGRPEGGALLLCSQAVDRTTYLQRPDLGRTLDLSSKERLRKKAAENNHRYDLAIVVVDGLSSLAVQQHTLPFLSLLLKQLQRQSEAVDAWSLAPISIVEQGRVAIGDEIGERLNARAVLVLIGERPGLSSPDSLGLYLTWAPRSGLTDANRNCISNVRQGGLDYTDAVDKTMYLLTEAHRRKLTGVKLKERTESTVIEQGNKTKNFLIS